MSRRWGRGAPVALAAMWVATGGLGGCTDSVKVSEQQAAAHADELAKLVDADVNEIRRGLPAGGKKIAATLFVGEKREATPQSAREALKKTRESVVDLQLAKSTFFAVTDLEGVAWANDQETDAMSGKNILATLPALQKAKGGAYAEVVGSLEEARGAKAGPDEQWFAAAPVVAADGATRGVYVTGWSFRRFAFHLEQQLKTNLRHAAKGESAAKAPLVYAFVVRGDRTYGAPVTPEVNVKAIEGLALSTKLKGDAPWQGRVDITGRTFGVAARRVEIMCPDCAVAVLRSEI